MERSWLILNKKWQIYRTSGKGLLISMGLILVLATCSHKSVLLTQMELKTFPIKSLTSVYFDDAMEYRDSLFEAVDLSEVADRYASGSEFNGFLLDCFDDYQGFISLDEVHRYDLHLATQLKIGPGFKVPSWLKPMLTLVPDGQNAPKVERFITANIRSLRFIRSEDYYRPIHSVAESQPVAEEGLRRFKNNCLMCHSIQGVGGNKGIPLLEAYDYSRERDRVNFMNDFLGFHYNGDSDQKNVGKFISGKKLNPIVEFLRSVQKIRKLNRSSQ